MDLLEHGLESPQMLARGNALRSRPYKRFTCTFRVQSRCAGDVCSQIDPSQHVKRFVRKGAGYYTPA